MYSGNYYSDDGHIKIPDNYNGTSLLEGAPSEEINTVSHIEIPKTEMKISPSDEKRDDTEEVFFNKPEPEKESLFDITSIFKTFGIKGIHFGNIIPKIGTEELLLIALAAFLLFSKNGDKECALLVFLLIFIK